MQHAHSLGACDEKALKITATSDRGDVQIFYSRSGQIADVVIERLAGKTTTTRIAVRYFRPSKKPKFLQVRTGVTPPAEVAFLHGC
jgi:hypothetical protein